MKKKNYIIYVGLIIIVGIIICINSTNKNYKEKKITYNGNNLLINIDGNSSNVLPTSGNYYLVSYDCSNKDTEITWDRENYELDINDNNNKTGISCKLNFESKPLLTRMKIGSYVKYVGEGGTVGSTNVNCKKNGSSSSPTAEDETEAPNSCLGQNAREDLDTSDYTYGYCHNTSYKYYTTGWRIAYIDSNNKPVIVSAGSPECNARGNVPNNTTYIKLANTKAMKYCNSDLVDGNCICLDSDSDGYCDCTDNDADGLCDEIENGTVNAWAMNDLDFYNITKTISRYGKRLAGGSSSLGDSGGSLGTILYCDYQFSHEECGYNNNLIDNGGIYWFAARYTSSDPHNMVWLPDNRVISSGSSTGAFGLRPVIKLASTVIVTGGSGTMEDPYELDRDDSRDAVRPVCSITGPTTAPTTGYIKNGQTLTYTLTCTDNSGSLGDSTITTSDLTSNNTSVMTITSIGTKTAVSNGYSWPITVTAGATTGSARILLNENAISDSVGNPNESLTSTQLVSVDNDGPTCGTVSVTAGTTTNTTTQKAVSNATVQVLCTDTLSGCSATSSSKTVSSNGSGTISITDKLGNSTSCSYNVSNVIYNLKITSTKYQDSTNNFKSCAGYWYQYKMVYTITATGSGLSSGMLCYSPSNGGATSGCGSYPNSDNYNYGCACFDSASTWTFYRSNSCSYGKACNAKGLCVYKYQCTS